jgi:hypothetical protein
MSLLKLRFIRNPVLVSYSICTRQGSSDLSGSQSALACLCVCARAKLGLREFNTEQANSPNKTTLTSAKTLFIHWQYHQYDIDRTVLRRLYDETLKGFDWFDAMTVCYSRPKNLRDILANTVLEQPPDEKMSEIVESMKTQTQERKINT